MVEFAKRCETCGDDGDHVEWTEAHGWICAGCLEIARQARQDRARRGDTGHLITSPEG